jgi:cystathionine beta-synthase
MIQAEDKESFLMTRDLLTREGLYSGISSGSAVVGAMKWIKSQKDQYKGKNVLIILPDSGNRYMSKAYNDDWMREAGFLDRSSMGTVGDLLRTTHTGQSPVILAKQSEKVSNIIEKMREKNISQLPVSDDAGWIKGIVTEGAVLAALYEGRIKPQATIEQLVDPSIEFVNPEDPIEKVSRLVTAGKIPLITDPSKHGELLGIITKIDLLTFLGNRT